MARGEAGGSHRASGDGSRRGAGDADARGDPGRAVAGERALGQVRQGAAPPEGSLRARLLLRSDPRGGGHRSDPPGGALVPRSAEEPLPDPGQVPRRGPAALRAHARARVHHEGRLLVPRRRRRRAARVPGHVRRVRAHLRALRAHLPGRRGRHRRHRRRPVARVPGARRVGRGRHRVLRAVRLRRQRGEGGGEAAAGAGRDRGVRWSAS